MGWGGAYCCDPCEVFAKRNLYGSALAHTAACNRAAAAWDDRAHARTTDPDTSHEAAAGVNVTKANQEVLDALGVTGPTTSDRVADYLGKDLTLVSPRFAPLRRAGKIRDSGRRMPTTRGRKNAIVWELVE